MLKTPYNRTVLQGWNLGLWLKIIHSGFGSFCDFFFPRLLQNAFIWLQTKPEEAQKPCDHLTDFGFLSISGHWDCELHFSEAECLKAKLSHTGPVCSSRMVLRITFSFPLQRQQQSLSSWDPIRAGVGGVAANIFKMHLCDLVSVQFPPYHALSAKRAVISTTQCTVDIFI